MYIKIYKEKKSATQSCLPSNDWILEVVSDKDALSCKNEMHWNSSYDSLKQIRKLNFKNRESAEKFAASMGMDIVSLEDEKKKKIKRKTYLTNYQE